MEPHHTTLLGVDVLWVGTLLAGVAAFAVMLALGTFAWRMWPAHIAASEDRNHTRIECVLAGGDTGPAPGPFTGGDPPCAFAERWIFGSVPE